MTLLFSGLVLVIQVTFSGFVFTLYSVYRKEEFYGQLQSRARVYGRILLGRPDVKHLRSAKIPPGDLLTLTDEQISIYDQKKQLLFDNQNAEPNSIEQKLLTQVLSNPAVPVRFTQGETEGIGTVFLHDNQRYAIFVAGSDELGYARRNNLLMLLVLGNVGGLVLAFLAGWFFSGRFLKPLAVLANTVRRYSEARLRTPLNHVLGTLEPSFYNDKEPEEMRRNLKSTIEEIQEINHLTTNLLSLTKFISEPLELTPVRLDECVIAAVGQVQQKYPDRTIELTVEGLDDFPVVKGNEALLTTAVANVIENACKYSEDAVKVRIEFSSANPSQYSIQITDRGRGIAEADIPPIFDPLAQGKNREKVAVFGLGLAITYQLVSLHRGQIYFQKPSDGIGTLVHIQFPAAR
ncbi:MAG TPA: HAMP domain-containing sensor histidine kinase [Telluribacter sp.]|nr:HAMP domain-containing sensor histidine kinase [Telluribacter sp.]